MRHAIWLLALICFGFAAPAHAEKRVALVIGNANYKHISVLPNVPNDAVAMAAVFKAANFDAVDVRRDLGVAELRQALKKFAVRAADADVAVVFYAGHGIEVGQVNYLIPVDARLVTDFDVEDETVPLERVLQAMEPAKRLRLVLLDACRENPFVRSMKGTVAARSVARGLGRVEPTTTNTLIAFATKPNAIAADGKGPNSPFTAALVKHLLTPGLDVRIALGYVRDEVLIATAKRQEPYVTGSLGGGIVSIAGGSSKRISRPSQLSELEADEIVKLAEAVKKKADDEARKKEDTERQRLALLKQEEEREWSKVEPGAPPRYKLDPSQSYVIALSNLFSQDNCLPDNWEGRVVARQFDERGIVVTGVTLEDAGGHRSFLNVEVDLKDVSRVTSAWVIRGLQTILKEGNTVSFGVLLCGASGGVVMVHSIALRAQKG